MLPKRAPTEIPPSEIPAGSSETPSQRDEGGIAPAAPERQFGRAFRVLAVDLTVLLVFSFFMCVYKTGAASFGGGDQTTHAKVIQEMHYSGNWLHPTLYNWPYYNKPPFKMWLTLIPISIWGETNFAYRVIDGLCGVFLALTLFLFARSQFRSRTIAWLTTLGLLGSQLLYYGHGIRNAVQDGMMLLLLTLGTIAGYFMVEKLLSDNYLASKSRRSIWTLAVLGGLSIGLGAMTKNVAAYFSFAVIGIYLIAIGEVVTICKRGWQQLAVTFALAFGCPAAYIIAQGPLRFVAFQMLVVTEVYKRATTGYHMVGHNWMYWNTIVHSRATVPPELLFPAAAFALWMIVRHRSRPYSLALTWAVVPIVLQTMAKSKLMWYMMPALPGLSLIFGAGVGSCLLTLNDRIKQGIRIRHTLPALTTAAFLFLGIYTATAVGIQMYGIVDIFLNRGRLNEAEGFTNDVLNYAATTGSMPKIVIYGDTPLARPEKFYFNRLGIDRAPDDLEALRARVQSGEVTFVMTTKDHFTEIAKLGTMTSFELSPKRDNRYVVLVIVSFHKELLPRFFTPVSRRISLVGNDTDFKPAFGFKGASTIGRTAVRPTAGARAGIILPAGFPEQQLGTDVALQLASTLPTAGGLLRVHVFLNDQRVALLDSVTEGFRWRHFYVPPGVWRNGDNLMTFVFEPPAGQSVTADAQLALFGSLILTLNPSLD